MHLGDLGILFITFKGTKWTQKDIWDMQCLLQLLTWLHVSTTVIFGIMNDRNDKSILLYGLAPFNYFT